MRELKQRRTMKVWQLLMLVVLVSLGIYAGFDIVSTKPRETTSAQVNTVHLDEMPQAILTASNDYRKEKGLNILPANKKLVMAAQDKADGMCKGNYFAHDLPDGQKWFTILAKYEYSYEVAGENLAKGYSTVEGVMKGWKDSPLHNANLIGDWNEMGTGYSLCDGKRYMVQEFGKSSVN
jgi:uncharacterized protein YkwD